MNKKSRFFYFFLCSCVIVDNQRSGTMEKNQILNKMRRTKDKNLYNENDFYVGNLLPDTRSAKKVSHLRYPESYGHIS